MTTLAKAEDERLRTAMKNKNDEIEKLKLGRNENPSIYIQNSHSEQTWDCLKVPENTLLILLGASGTSSMAGHEKALTDDAVIKLLKEKIIIPENPKLGLKKMNKKLSDLRDHSPNITFHYSNYFGIKQTDANPRRGAACVENGRFLYPTESYYDLIYDDAAIFEEEGQKIRKMGLTTLDQFKTYVNIDVNKEPIDKEFYNSLDVLPYHTFQKINHIKGNYIHTDNYKEHTMEELQHIYRHTPATLKTYTKKYTVDQLKTYIPYFDVRNHSEHCPWREWYSLDSSEYEYCKYPVEPCIGCPDFKTIQALYEYYDLQYKEKPDALENGFYKTLKLSDLMKATGPGIYIHYACRPFIHALGDPDKEYDEENLTARENILGVRANSNATLESAQCPLKKNIKASGINNEIIGTYNNCYTIETVTIAENVTKIKNGAFAWCTKLKTVNFEDNRHLTELDKLTFFQCVNLDIIEFPDSINKLGEKVFKGCSSLKTVKLPKNLAILERGLFEGCVNLTTVRFPEANLKEIKSSVFMNTGLTKVNLSLSPNLKNIDFDAFSECKKLTNIVLPNSVETLELCAFYRCTNLTKVTLSNNIKVIKVWTFAGCENLTTINIPEKLEKIEKEAFKDCKLLTTLVFPDDVTKVTIDPTAFSGCDKLTKVSVYKGIIINDTTINESEGDFSLGSKSVILECRPELTKPVTVEGIDTKPKISKTKPNRKKKNKRSKTKPNRRKKNKKNKKNSKRSKKNSKRSKKKKKKSKR